MTKQKISPAIDLLIPSIEVIKNNLPVYFLLSVLPSLLVTIGTRKTDNLFELFTPFGVFGSLLAFIFLAPLMYTYTMTAKGKEVSIQEALTEGFKYFLRITGLVIVVSVLIVLGLMLFIIPGLIVLRRYFLSFYFLIDKNLSIKEAMKLSAETSKKNSFAIYGLLGIIFLFGFFSIIPGIGTVLGAILQFLYSVAPAIRYFEMKKAYK